MNYTIFKYFILLCSIGIVELSAQSSKTKSKSNKIVEKKNQDPTRDSLDPKSQLICDQEGWLKFITDKGDCTLYIETKEGKKYIPVEFPENTHLEKIEGEQKIRFSYELMKNIKLNCPITNLYIKLNCIENYSDHSNNMPMFKKTDKCEEIVDPYSIDWMNQCIIKLKPKEIVKYESGDKWVYSFLDDNKNYYYNCYGEMMCIADQKNKCEFKDIELTNPVTILVVNY
jgi:hypothetical protein